MQMQAISLELYNSKAKAESKRKGPTSDRLLSRRRKIFGKRTDGRCDGRQMVRTYKVQTANAHAALIYQAVLIVCRESVVP